MGQSPVSRTRGVALAYLSSAGFSSIGLVASLLATPLTLKWLGVEQFGYSRALLDLYGYHVVLDFAIRGGALPSVADAVASGDRTRLLQTLASVTRVVGRSTAIKLLLGVALAILAPLLLKGPRQELLVGGLILSAGFVATLALSLTAMMLAQQRQHLVNVVYGAQALLTILLSCWFAKLGHGVAGQAAAQSIGVLGAAFAVLALNLDLVRGAVRAGARGEAAAVVEIARKGRLNMLRALCSMLSLTSDRLYVARILGGEAVAQFHTSVRLAEVASPQAQGVGNAAWPAFVDMHVRGEHDLFRKRLSEITLYIVVFAVALLGPAMVVNKRFVALWIGPSLFGGWALTSFACLNVVLIAVISFWDWCLVSLGRIERLMAPTTVSSVVNVAATVLLTHVLGLFGGPLATSFSLGLVTLPWLVVLLGREFAVAAPALLSAFLRPLVVGAALMLALRVAFADLVARGDWLTVALVAVASSGSWALVALGLLMSREQRRESLGRLRSGWRRVRGKLAGRT